MSAKLKLLKILKELQPEEGEQIQYAPAIGECPDDFTNPITNENIVIKKLKSGEVRNALDDLLHEGLIVFDNEYMLRLTHRGFYYTKHKCKELLIKILTTVLIPIAVSAITAVITELWLN